VIDLVDPTGVENRLTPHDLDRDSPSTIRSAP